MPTCYQSDVTDHDYFATLNRYGLTEDRPWHANVEALDLRATVALLTFVLRADHFCEGSLMGSLKDGYLPRVLRRIAELDGTRKRPNVITFYYEYDEYGFLSNWCEAPFAFDGNTFPTAEHWMMWQKARLFGDDKTAEKILAASDPGEVKRLGRQVHLLREAATDPRGTRERLRSELAGVSRDEVRSGGYVLHTLKAAKWCFANTSTYRDCVPAAVNLGSDTDTTACVAGALAGTAYGMAAIPAEWLATMRGADVLEATLF